MIKLFVWPPRVIKGPENMNYSRGMPNPDGKTDRKTAPNKVAQLIYPCLILVPDWRFQCKNHIAKIAKVASIPSINLTGHPHCEVTRQVRGRV